MESLLVFASIPVPRDLMLPLPLPEAHLKFLLVVFFLLHIFFVNLMVGGSLQTIIFEILGLRNPKYDRLARKIAETVTVNKSLAVVMGIGPLLCINLLYTAQFYAANVMTGHAWAALVPLVITAFLLTYLHKYTWEKWAGSKKPQHLAVGALACLFFLLIPVIFLSNINLMLFPDKWSEVKGFLSSLKIGNVLPRYLHFLAACNAITGLFLTGWLGRPGYPVQDELPEFSRPEIRRLFYGVAFYVTLAQFFLGPVVLITLPTHGLSSELLWTIGGGVMAALLVLVVLFMEITAHDSKIGRFYWPVVILFSAIVLMMGTGRHMYREACLAEQKQYIRRHTDEFRAMEYAIEIRKQAGLDAVVKDSEPAGKTVYAESCSMCHALDKVLVGPSVSEIAALYKGNPAGIVAWAKAPGKKRENMVQMPSQSYLGEEKLKLVAEYLLQAGEGAAKT